MINCPQKLPGRSAARVRLVLLLLGLALVVPGCRQETYYDQSTAQATVEALAEMLRNGEVRRIPQLIQTDDENLKRTLQAAGVISARMQNLSKIIQAKYPDEVAVLLERIKADTAKQLEKTGRQRGQMGRGERFKGLLADPDGTFTELLKRVEVVYANDEMQSLLFDGQPALGGIILMQNSTDGKWYFEWPEQIPGLGTAMPKTEAEWKILRAILKTIANGVDWTEQAVQEGKAKNLEQVYRAVMQNVVPNILIGWLIYQQALTKRPGESTDDNG